MTILLDLDSSSVSNNLSGLRAQLRARGFTDYDDGECDRLLNTAYMEICDMEDWPFLEQGTSGPAPLSIPSLRKVVSVQNATSKKHIERMDRSYVIASNLDPQQPGDPLFYWIYDGEIHTWPVGGTLSVRFFRVPPKLTSGADEPMIPDRFRDIIVLGAARVGMLDDSAPEDLADYSREYERRLEVMRQALLYQHYEAQTIQVRMPSEDYW